MRILLINPPYQTLTSNIGVGHQIPLGLLAIGGPLIDAGHCVRLLDAERLHLSCEAIVGEVRRWNPQVIMTGHAGSTPAHPICMEVLARIKQAFPHVFTVYGGVYPSYHAAEILQQHPFIDSIVRGEGEAASLEMMRALEANGRNGLRHTPGIAFRADDEIVETRQRPPIDDLNAWRVGWELITDWDLYQCFGLGRAAIVQFSRGCPHRCTYCGQHEFWQRWRHRNPVRLANEIQWLCHRHRIRFITLADENPTTDPALWQAFLEELAGRKLPVHFFATIRAFDIARDAKILPLYRKAGILYVLMGVDSTNHDVLKTVRKGSTPRHDVLACRLLRQYGIFSILGHIVGLEEETWRSFRMTSRRLKEYDADYLNAMYATPHDWTPFGRAALSGTLVEPDQRKWDYRHQVLAHRQLRPWQLLAGVKWIELCFHLRPRRLKAALTGDPFARRQFLWCAVHTGAVWICEIVEFLVGVVRRRRRCHRLREQTLTTASKQMPRSVSLAVVNPPPPLMHA